MQISGIDFFAGAGGFSLAARRAGVHIRAAVELDKHACESYRANLIKRKHNPPHLFEGDIRKIEWPEFLKKAKVTAGHCDIVVGGPPCQGFSAHRIKGAGINDPRNSLLFSYFDCIGVVRPRTFIVENVTGLLWPRHKDYLEKFTKLADEAGYSLLGPTVLNARDFGAPQNRKRVFIVGVRKDQSLSIKWPPPATHFHPESDQITGRRKKAWKTASSVFELPIKLSDLNNCHMQSGEKMIAVFASTPLNGGSRKDSSRVLPCHDEHNGHKDVYGRIDPNRPGPTMTTACINPSKGRFLHPTENHGISVRHAARFQCFPEQFVFSGGLIASGVQVGNAVPIPLGAAVLRPVIRALMAANKREADRIANSKTQKRTLTHPIDVHTSEHAYAG
jgi:DNA (cytosine-5)-methyltransferase 1